MERAGRSEVDVEVEVLAGAQAITPTVMRAPAQSTRWIRGSIEAS
jgi:hypothetical protein